MNLLAEACVMSTSWEMFRTSSGTAEAVPDALRNLAEAETKEAARSCYWRLDNVIVLQGWLFEAAVPVVPVLLALLTGELPAAAKREIVELLQQIGCGETHRDEEARGNADLGDRCRRLIREGIWTVYGLLLDPDLDTRDACLALLQRVETDRERYLTMLQAVAPHDVSELCGSKRNGIWTRLESLIHPRENLAVRQAGPGAGGQGRLRQGHPLRLDQPASVSR